MAAYKVINLDSPIESDYWVDIPVRDPATNKDAVDEEGRILVKRHVTRSVKNEEMSTINTAVETVNTLKEDYSTFKEEVSTKINSHDSNILTNTNNITTLTDSVANHDLQINALYSKINAIKGIDIDDFKLVTETNIKNIKSSYLPLAGGTLTGNLFASSTNQEINIGVKHSSVGNIYLYAKSTDKGLYAVNPDGRTGYSIISLVGDNVTFNGSLNGNATSSTKTTNDSVDRNIVNTYALKSHYPDRIGINWDTTFKGYVNLTVDQTTFGLITTANIAQQAVNYANTCNKANSATTAGSANTAVSCTNADTLDGYHHDSFPKVNSALFTVNGLASPGWSAIGTGKGGSCIQVKTTDNTYPSICFHRSGYSHCVLAESGGQLGTMYEGNGTFNYLITTANIGSQSVNHATNADNAKTANSATNAGHATSADSATNASHATNADHATTADTANRAYPRKADGNDINFHWEGKDGQPTWLWGGEDGTNMYVYNPATFSVNRANGANEATNAYNLRATSHNDHFVKSEWDGSYFWTWVRAPDGGYRPVRVERANSAGYADNAGTASRSTNNGSFFINGYEVSVG